MNQILAYIGYFFLLVNFILFVRNYSKQSKAYKVFTFYLGLIVGIQIFSEILIQQKTNNLFLSHFYFVGQFILLSFFYFSLLGKVQVQRKIIKGGLVLGILILAVQYYIDPSLFFKFNLVEIFITSFVLIIFSTFHFYNLLNEKKEFYYINIGILMYLFGSTVLFFVGNLMASLSPVINKIPWIMNSVLYIIYQIFISIEWYKSYSNKATQEEK